MDALYTKTSHRFNMYNTVSTMHGVDGGYDDFEV